MSIGSTLFPPANRQAALVAFLRTFWQTVRATGLLGGTGAIVVSAADLQHLNLTALAYIAGAVLASGVLSGAIAAGDILTHGLPDAYQNAAVANAVNFNTGASVKDTIVAIAQATPAPADQPAVDLHVAGDPAPSAQPTATV